MIFGNWVIYIIHRIDVYELIGVISRWSSNVIVKPISSLDSSKGKSADPIKFTFPVRLIADNIKVKILISGRVR